MPTLNKTVVLFNTSIKQNVKKKPPKNRKSLCPRSTQLGHYLDAHIKQKIKGKSQQHSLFINRTPKVYFIHDAMHKSIAKGPFHRKFSVQYSSDDGAQKCNNGTPKLWQTKPILRGGPLFFFFLKNPMGRDPNQPACFLDKKHATWLVSLAIGCFFLKKRVVGRFQKSGPLFQKLGPPPFFLKKNPMGRGPSQALWFSNQKMWNKSVHR